MIFRNMKKHFLLTIACLLTGMTASAQQYQWKNVPIVGGGFVDGFILHPTNPDVRFCRTDMGGAYRWDAVNKEWIQMLDWVSLDNQNLQGVESVAIDPNNDQKVYLACGTYTIKTGSILKSNDGGRSFIEVKVPIAMGGNENGRGNGERMMVDPLNSRNIYFGTRLNGLWKSVDEGMTWKRVDTFPDVTEQTDFSNPQNRMNRGSGIIAVVFDKKEKKGNDAKNIFVAVSLKDRQSIFERYSGVLVSDDFAEIAKVFGQRVADAAEEIIQENERACQEVGMNEELMAESCAPVSYEDSIENKVVVIKGSILRPEFRHANYQLMLCTGGFGALGKYIEAIEGTDAEERYIKSDWYFDSNLYLRRIEIPGGEVGRPAKIITQSPDNIDQLDIFGQQDYIQTSKPESMSCKEIYRWSDWERQNMK